MAYITETDITTRISAEVVIQLTDDETLTTAGQTLAEAKAANSAIAGRITAAIADAESLLNGYLRKQYKVPLDSATDFVKTLALDLAVFNLHDRRGAVLELPKSVQSRRDLAVKTLERINRGELDAGLDVPPPASSAVLAEASSTEAVFTADTMEDF